MRIEELIYGGWVLLASEVGGDPVRVRDIVSDGTLWVERDGERIATTLDGVMPMPIDSVVLQRFCFKPAKGDNVWMKKVRDMRLTIGLRRRQGVEQCRRCAISGRLSCWNEEIRFVHELQRWWNDRVYFVYDIPLRLVLHDWEQGESEASGA